MLSFGPLTLCLLTVEKKNHTSTHSQSAESLFECYECPSDFYWHFRHFPMSDICCSFCQEWELKSLAICRGCIADVRQREGKMEEILTISIFGCPKSLENKIEILKYWWWHSWEHWEWSGGMKNGGNNIFPNLVWMHQFVSCSRK